MLNMLNLFCVPQKKTLQTREMLNMLNMLNVWGGEIISPRKKHLKDPTFQTGEMLNVFFLTYLTFPLF